MLLLILLYLLPCSLSQCPEYSPEVNQLVDEIEDFLNSSNYWINPTNNLEYYNGLNANNNTTDHSHYDFVIIGAGSSGSVLANRLSEIKEWKILLIEAGGEENNITDVPGLVNDLRLSNYNWGYHTTSQKVQGGYINNSIIIPRGKALGGSSVINAMIYARGNRKDFDLWGKNNPGWDYQSVLPYFKKSEHASFPNADPIYHGINGTLNVEYPRVFNNLTQAFLTSNLHLGRKWGDYNAQSQMVFSPVELNEKNGRRDSAAKAFLDILSNRNNIKIINNAFVTKIFISNKTAVAVEYEKNGKKFVVGANKEVILSAGALNTPQILMLSGVGPRDQLEKHGIKQIVDLPVGKSLKDHLIIDTLQFSTSYYFENDSLCTQVNQYLHGKGPMTSPGNAQAIGYVNLMGKMPPDVPDVEHVFHSGLGGSQSYHYYSRAIGYTEEVYEGVIKPTENRATWTIHSVLLHPKSTGSVLLKSSCPYDFPIVDPRYLSHPLDVKTLVASVKDTMVISKSPAFKTYNSTLIRPNLPQCNKHAFGSDLYWECFVRNMATTVHHFTGTAKMGPRNDRTAVVDHNLKVHGIKRLRVIDCSVIPITPSGHTNAPAYMLAEKAADIIKKEYKV